MASGWLEVEVGSPFPPSVLPFGVLSLGDGPRTVGVAVGDAVIDVGAVAARTSSSYADLLRSPTLTALLASGPNTWHAVRAEIGHWLTDPSLRQAVEPHLLPRAEVTLHLPWEVADYVDFYASEHHATNVGRILRPDGPPLRPNWRHLPVGYHGRAGTVVVSGTPLRRPCGQRLGDDNDRPMFGPTQRLDIEAEVGFVVGSPSTHGSPVPVADFEQHVFGVCLVNDWSARDVQAWESQPLGPFLGKSFATSVSPWVVPLAALQAARRPVPSSSTDLLPYLRETQPWGLDLQLEVRINGTVVARPSYDVMHWSPAQMLAHLTVNGASVRTGDLFASGTVSGPDESSRGCLLELTWGGTRPLRLDDGTTRTFLEDGDEVVIAATAPGVDGTTIGLGEVRGRVLAASRG